MRKLVAAKNRPVQYNRLSNVRKRTILLSCVSISCLSVLCGGESLTVSPRTTFHSLCGTIGWRLFPRRTRGKRRGAGLPNPKGFQGMDGIAVTSLTLTNSERRTIVHFDHHRMQTRWRRMSPRALNCWPGYRRGREGGGTVIITSGFRIIGSWLLHLQLPNKFRHIVENYQTSKSEM